MGDRGCSVKFKIVTFSPRSRTEICYSPYLTKKKGFGPYMHEKALGHKLGFLKVRIIVEFVICVLEIVFSAIITFLRA